ncbi:MAG: nucleoside hydrolase [Pseudomonadota bacterium]
MKSLVDCFSSQFFQKKTTATSLLFFGLFLFTSFAVNATANQSNSIILDTDISSDVDDAGAVAVLHTLANQDKVHILAMMVSSGDPWSGLCLDTLNDSFGRPGIPIGVIKHSAVTHVSKYTKYLAEHYRNTFSKNFEKPSAVELYREVLASQPNDSITVVSVGYLSNLSRLLESGPDQYSPLNGKDLVTEKVKRLVCMGGEFPRGREWNIYQDAVAATIVVADWPTPVIFCGFEIGSKIMTGKILNKAAENHPLREAYRLYNNLTNRQSWDQATVLLAANLLDGTTPEKYLDISCPGKVLIDREGNTIWQASQEGRHRFVISNSKTKELARIIDEMMLSATLTHHPQ